MPLDAGDKMGPYEITGLLGKGGMGEVYRARDTRLHREVAIKVSAEEFSDRFEKEARAVAALNCGNIGHLYDVGPNYLVLELVEGETLADQIRRGAIPLEDALGIARQIGDALEAAHEKGIVHRDLKPANIKITPEGVVKVLDFGLAKMADAVPQPGSNPEHSPTLSFAAATRAGAVMGTAGYMAPEQAKGKVVDKRADIWAFGVVLYEMVTGRRLFQGEDLTDILASVVKEQPDLSAAPARVRRLLGRCLEKDPKKRLRDIGDAWELLEEPVPAAVGSGGEARLGRLPLAACAVLTLSTVAFAYLWLRTPAPEVRDAQFQIEDGATGQNLFHVAISPDGRYVVFSAGAGDNPQLWLRPLDSVDGRPLPGTEGAVAPFWSPDSKSVGFFANRRLKRTEIAGGAPQTLCDLTSINVRFGSGAWNREGTIVFRDGEGIASVAATGGVPRLLLKRFRGSVLQFLPDGKHFLYLSGGGIGGGANAGERGVYAASLENPEAGVKILATERKAAHVRSRTGGTDYLLWMRENTLLAQPFDLANLRLEGDPTPVAEDVMADVIIRAAFWASEVGVLCFRRSGSGGKSNLIWLGRDGKRLGEAAPADSYRGLRLSPDGTRVALTKEDAGGSADVWALEFGRGVATRLTFDPANEFGGPWSPDGRQMVCSARRNGSYQLYKMDAGGGGKEELLVESQEQLSPSDWSRDGRYLGYARYTATGVDIWALPLEGDRKPFPVLETPYTERGPKFSPDGKWIAYESNASGRFEIYVRAFPTGPGQWQVSNQGGANQFWSGDGKELYYVNGTRDKVMAAGIRVEGGSIQADAPRELFAVAGGIPSGAANFGVTADGQRFLVLQPAGGERVLPPLTVVTHWEALLRK